MLEIPTVAVGSGARSCYPAIDVDDVLFGGRAPDFECYFKARYGAKSCQIC